MRILAVIGIVVGLLFAAVGTVDVWTAFRVKATLVDASGATSSEGAFVVWLTAGGFYFALGFVLFLVSLAVWRGLSWASKAWLVATSAIAAVIAVTHYGFRLGSLPELLVIASMAVAGLCVSYRTRPRKEFPNSG